MKTFIGLESDQFNQVFTLVSQSLLALYKDFSKATIALYIYLMKLKTNHTNAQIGSHFGLTSRSISSRIRNVREIVHKDFAPNYLFHRSRNELLEHTTESSRILYQKNDKAVVSIWDATYLFVIRSSNYKFQKDSYSVQKKRNLLKVMLCVMPNGLIAGVYGPYSARANDASIMNDLIDKNPNIFSSFCRGDVIVLDRGFRDSITKLKSKGFDVKIPECFCTKNQLSTKQANYSRLVTKTRYMIEVRNTHIKNKWKYLSATKNVESLPFLMKDFEVCTALVNAFCCTFISDKNDFEIISKRMLELRDTPNRLSNLVGKIPRNSFKLVVNLTLFPKLTFNDLKHIALGTYQISQARSYAQIHLKANQNRFIAFYCGEEACQNLCAKMGINKSKHALIYIKLQSRFQSMKHHNAYILFDVNASGRDVVVAYCCSCKNGLRTIGCCSHIMCSIWHIYYKDHNTLKLPSTQLNTVLQSDSDSSTEEFLSGNDSD